MEVKPGYEQTEVGVIPEDWEVNNLERFWAITDCKHLTADFVDAGIPVASIKEVQSRFVDLDNANQTTEFYYSKLIEGGRKPLPGDLIFSRNATVGEAAQVAEWHPLFAMGQDVCLLRKKSLAYSSDYLQEVIRSPIVVTQLENLMVGSTFKRVNVEQIKSLKVPMPSANEQTAIATALSDVDALIQSLERLIAKKRDIKQGTMQELLTGKKRLPGFDGEWSEFKLIRLTSMPVTDGPHLTPQFLNDGVPFLSVNNLVDHKINWIDLRYISKNDDIEFSKKCKPKKGDILLGKAATVGTVALVESDIDFNIWSPLALIRIRNDHVARYFYYCLQTPMLLNQINLLTNSSSQGNIGMKDIEKLEFSVPVKKEQTAIATVLSDMDAEIAALEGKLAKAHQIKEGMMQELLTGRIRLS